MGVFGHRRINPPPLRDWPAMRLLGTASCVAAPESSWSRQEEEPLSSRSASRTAAAKAVGGPREAAALEHLLRATKALREKQSQVLELRRRRCALEEELRRRLQKLPLRASAFRASPGAAPQGASQKEAGEEAAPSSPAASGVGLQLSALQAFRRSWTESLGARRQSLETLATQLRASRQDAAAFSAHVRRRELALRCLRARALQSLLQLFALENDGSERFLRGLPVPPIPRLLNLLQRQRLEAETVGAALGLFVHFVLLVSRYLDLLPLQRSLCLRGSKSFVCDPLSGRSLPLFVRDAAAPSELSLFQNGLLKLAALVEALALERSPAGGAEVSEEKALDVLLVVESLVHRELYGLRPSADFA